MKLRTLGRSLLFAMMAACFLIVSGWAQYPAFDTAFGTSVVYQNRSASVANLRFEFFEHSADTSPTIYPTQIAGNAGGTLFVRDVAELSDGTRSSVVLRSDQLLGVTLVSFPLWSNSIKSRMITNSIVLENNTAFVASVLKNVFDTYTILSIQNTSTSSIMASINFLRESKWPVNTSN